MMLNPVALLLSTVILATANPLRGQTPPRDDSSLPGTWRGTSICTPAGKPACHDETVVYHIRTIHSDAKLTKFEIAANKIVNGVEEEMGTQTCFVKNQTTTIQCPMRGWMWSFDFDVTSDAHTIRGVLKNPTGVIWRNVNVTQVSSH